MPIDHIIINYIGHSRQRNATKKTMDVQSHATNEFQGLNHISFLLQSDNLFSEYCRIFWVIVLKNDPAYIGFL